jgi:protein involved in polysaccharide export with SLBB domain
MKPGKGWSLWKAAATARHPSGVCAVAPVCAVALLTLLGAGCASDHNKVEKQLLADKLNGKMEALDNYRVAFPDELEIRALGRPEASGQFGVGLDGRIDLGAHQKIRAEGRTVADITKLVAGQIGLPADHVRVRVLEYQSQPLFLLGQVRGWQRTIAYQGQETVLDVLQRVGGIAPGAAPDDVYVVRAHVADGQRPEVFHVDLDAMVIKKDQRTNIRVLPYDQIYVGESRQAKVLKCVPPWLKPLFLAVWGPLQSRPDARSLHLRRPDPPQQTPEPEEAEPPLGEHGDFPRPLPPRSR